MLVIAYALHNMYICRSHVPVETSLINHTFFIAIINKCTHNAHIVLNDESLCWEMAAIKLLCYGLSLSH